MPAGIHWPTWSRNTLDGDLMPRALLAALKASLAKLCILWSKEPAALVTPLIMPCTILEPTETIWLGRELTPLTTEDTSLDAALIPADAKDAPQEVTLDTAPTMADQILPGRAVTVEITLLIKFDAALTPELTRLLPHWMTFWIAGEIAPMILPGSCINQFTTLLTRLLTQVVVFVDTSLFQPLIVVQMLCNAVPRLPIRPRIPLIKAFRISIPSCPQFTPDNPLDMPLNNPMTIFGIKVGRAVRIPLISEDIRLKPVEMICGRCVRIVDAILPINCPKLCRRVGRFSWMPFQRFVRISFPVSRISGICSAIVLIKSLNKVLADDKSSGTVVIMPVPSAVRISPPFCMTSGICCIMPETNWVIA